MSPSDAARTRRRLEGARKLAEDPSTTDGERANAARTVERLEAALRAAGADARKREPASAASGRSHGLHGFTGFGGFRPNPEAPSGRTRRNDAPPWTEERPTDAPPRGEDPVEAAYRRRAERQREEREAERTWPPGTPGENLDDGPIRGLPGWHRVGFLRDLAAQRSVWTPSQTSAFADVRAVLLRRVNVTERGHFAAIDALKLALSSRGEGGMALAARLQEQVDDRRAVDAGHIIDASYVLNDVTVLYNFGLLV